MEGQRQKWMHSKEYWINWSSKLKQIENVNLTNLTKCMKFL
jgi:hypothetical protein